VLSIVNNVEYGMPGHALVCPFPLTVPLTFMCGGELLSICFLVCLCLLCFEANKYDDDDDLFYDF